MGRSVTEEFRWIMANVKVAIRVRPLTTKESADGGRLAVQVDDKYVKVRNLKLDGRADGAVDSREKLQEFCFDYCFWSVDPADPHYASQEEVFQELGVSVLSAASEGYNVCLFAYGQTGSGKTYTMMGTPDSIGLTPRICQGLFRSEDTFPDGQNTSRVEISFLEIYNERVRDLLRAGEQKKRASLRVREHPEKGPYVQDLSQHVVSNCKQAMELLEEGISNRITAATHNHDASSRSHAIFTIQYTQAILENNLPSEIVSKINLVDLAGSERADPNYCRDRLTEGSNINKSLVTLGIVISALAQNSQMSSSCQSINSVASEAESTGGSHSSSLSDRGAGGAGRRHCFIPYRDSVLTWLLKDSLGGNSKTIMIATVSPSVNSYNETLSTLRYAAHARNIVNKPRVNEDANVRLIRELREEIDRLKTMLLSFEMQRNPSPSLSDERDGNLSDIVLQNELKVEQLTKDWSESWRDKKELMEQYSVDINRDQAGFFINSQQPHLVSLDRDVLCTGVVFYHLREGITRIGPQDQFGAADIVLPADASCEIENRRGVVTLRPIPGCVCLLNDREVTEPCRLAQGAVITLGGVHKLRFNHPAEAALLRERRRIYENGMTGSYTDLCSLNSEDSVRDIEPEGQRDASLSPSEEHCARQRVEEQQRLVESLRREIQSEQRRADRDLEREQAHLRLQHSDIQQWILSEKQRLTNVEQKATQEFGIQTDLVLSPLLERVTCEIFKDDDDLPDNPPLQIARAKKKTVQEELLKQYSLRRTESRIRRKRLLYQLERIGRKRLLLEAKRELQILEMALPLGSDSRASPELVSTSKQNESNFGARRHSFSADILSRLYPQHTPIYKHFLKRNRSTDLSTNFSSNSNDSRDWASDECLPRERTQSCSAVFQRENKCSPNRGNSAENIMQIPKQESRNTSLSPTSDRPERKPLLPNRDLTFKIRSNQKSPVIVKSPTDTKVQAMSKENSQSSMIKEVTLNKRDLDAKTPSHQRKIGVGGIQQAFAGSRLKTALTKVFKKPPLGASRSHKPLGRLSGKFYWRKERREKDFKIRRNKCTIKSAFSCEALDQRTVVRDIQQRRWHSTENMYKTWKWVEKQQGLSGWEEEVDEEEKDGGHSDCESMFSLDSLSSAYATALAEQLKHEEEAQSDSSDDSEMSRDSLAVEANKKSFDVQKNTVAPSYTLVRDNFSSVAFNQTSLNTQIMPAEAYWSQQSTQKPKQGAEIVEKIKKYQVPKMENTSHKLSQNISNTPQSLSRCSFKEQDSQLALTDAWSSTEGADSPRIPRDSLHIQRQIRLGGVDRSSSDSPVSLNTTSDSTNSSIEAELVIIGEQTTDVAELNASTHCDVELSGQSELRKTAAEKSDRKGNSPACIPATATQMSKVESLKVIKAKQKVVTADITEATSSCQTAPGSQGQILNTVTANVFSSCDNGELCNEENCPEMCKNQFENTKESFYMCQVVSIKGETKDTEQVGGPQPELVKWTCKNARKRNNDRENLMGSLKIPKRSNSEELETDCATPANSQEDLCLSDKNNTKNSIDTDRPVYGFADNIGRDAMTLIAEADHNNTKHNSCEHTSTSTGLMKRKTASVKELNAKKVEPMIEIKRHGNRNHICQSEAICSAIDLRISEVVNEHVNSSLTELNCDKKSKSLDALQTEFTCNFVCSSHQHRQLAENNIQEILTLNSASKKFGQRKGKALKAQDTSLKYSSGNIDETSESNQFAPTMTSTAPKMGRDVVFQSGYDAQKRKESTIFSQSLVENSFEMRSTVGNSKATSSCTEAKDVTEPAAFMSCQSHKPTSPSRMIQQFQNLSHVCKDVKSLPNDHHVFTTDNGAVGKIESMHCTKKEVEKCLEMTSTLGQSCLVHLNNKSLAKLCCCQACPNSYSLAKNTITTEQCTVQSPERKSLQNGHNKSFVLSELVTAALIPKKVKSKRTRRCTRQSYPVSSSDSSVKSSDDEDGQTNRVFERRVCTTEMFNNDSKNINEKAVLKMLSPEFPATNKTSCGQQRLSLSPKILQQKSIENVKNCEQQRRLDSPMHFASSDINPYVHQWQDDETNDSYKMASFGSAANLSCKSPLLNSAEKCITRCLSVDNGLNRQNSPFNSHLSAYATNKGLSSTLSSVEDNRPPLKQPAVDNHAQLASLKINNTLSSNNNGPSGNTSSHDEIMFVYSSEQESQARAKSQRRRTCEHSTQTDKQVSSDSNNNSLKRKNRHQRSNTDGPVTQRSKINIQDSLTWASMESMSAHISKLIDSTSDLLGDVQGMRNGEVRKLNKSSNLSKISNRSLESNDTKDDDTQTAVSVAIQTKTEKENAQVNVIVKVMGAEVIAVAPDNNVVRVVKSVDDKTLNVSKIEIRSAGLERSQSQTEPFSTSAIKTTSADCQRRAKSSPSKGSKQQSMPEAPYHKSDESTHGKTAQNQTYSPESDLWRTSKEKATYTDRALSPIVTVGTRLSVKQKGEVSMARYQDGYTSNKNLEECRKLPEKDAQACEFSSNATYESTGNERSCSKLSEKCCASPKSTIDRCSDSDWGLAYNSQVHSSSSQRIHRKITTDAMQNYVSDILKQRQLDKGPNKLNSYDNFAMRTYNEQLCDETEHDTVSLSPSECNTDILINVEPLREASPLQDVPKVPEDLPMHNKFKNWSGINHGSRRNSSIPIKSAWQDCGKSRSCDLRDVDGYNVNMESYDQSGRKFREIQRLRLEREEVMASVSLSMNPAPLTVELTEAKLHYGLGQTDTLLKMLSPTSREEKQKPPPAAPIKQQLYDRHRKSIEGLRQEREARLQSYRRTRSLSPSKTLGSPPPSQEGPTYKTHTAPCERKHQLRQEVTESIRIPDPARGQGQCPSDIEQLLRDYSRARDEARSEIAKARERLRERTEQEKRRILHQALSQDTKDDLRHGTRVSNSTLCTGSSLSLSSGPTSGYQSGATQLQLSNTSIHAQDEEQKSPKGIKNQRVWLSAQDVRLDRSFSGFEPIMTSSPSVPSFSRHRAASFGSSSSTNNYQEITSSLLRRTLAEVQLASAGDLGNLLTGKVTAGWRYEGEERGVHAYYKPSSIPSVHSFLGVADLHRPLDSLWTVICQVSKSHMFNQTVRSVWTRPLDDSTQLVYIVTDPSRCHLSQPRDFCCISTAAKQGELHVLAMQSVLEECLPRPSLEAERGEMLPSCWMLQPVKSLGQEVTRVVFLLQIDLGASFFPQRLLNTVARKQAAVVADLDVFVAS